MSVIQRDRPTITDSSVPHRTDNEISPTSNPLFSIVRSLLEQYRRIRVKRGRERKRFVRYDYEQGVNLNLPWKNCRLLGKLTGYVIEIN